jgi:hypothetical protein
MGCDEVLAALREREASCRRETERLRAEAERIAALLAVCEQELARVSTACEVVGELPVAHGAVGTVRAWVPAPRAETVVPARGESAGRGGELCDRVLAVLAAHAGPVRCRQVVEALGLPAGPREVERVRHQLKKAAAAGRVVRTPGGLFTLTRASAGARG